jgi:protein-tyrosine-phosphatase
MLGKIIKYKKEAKELGKNPDSIDSFVMWMDEQKYKLEGEKEQIKIEVAKDLDKLIEMDDIDFAEILQINPNTAETILIMLEADREDIIKASVFDDFFMMLSEEEE